LRTLATILILAAWFLPEGCAVHDEDKVKLYAQDPPRDDSHDAVMDAQSQKARVMFLRCL
jgi:hypothetical protein